MRTIIFNVDLLTINEENRLKRKVDEVTEKQDEITLMKLKYEKEMKEMREEMELNFNT